MSQTMRIFHTIIGRSLFDALRCDNKSMLAASTDRLSGEIDGMDVD